MTSTAEPMKPKPITRILAATDFSPCADRAVDCAAFLAGACSAPLDILHVVEVPPDMHPDEAATDQFFEQRRRKAEQPLEQLVQRLVADGVAAKWRQRFGIPSQQVNAAADECQSDLVVVGTHGQTGLPHILLGSTAERIIRGAPCPVLTVRALPDSREAIPGRGTGTRFALCHILCPIDFSRCSVEALEYAAHLAQGFDASLTILHVLEPVFFDLELGFGIVPEYEQTIARVESRLADLCDVLAKHALTVRTVVSGGVLADAILAAAQPERCDLIVMGTHGRRGMPHVITGSVAEAVSRRACCPMLTVGRQALPPRERLIPAEIVVECCS